ncbi:DUF4129 domain-containing protein [Flavobacterium sp.]|uniref:DUF4129 domain-containing protein n=1 Tax=Flavobacterium sp. TaxID=239 RepID=UPI00121AC356|nr:DUF4129 domain-containing protein [Flavobacterium sp.]RZJ69630.1 MAG: DUF4129 domain-containing protein [Flavobacterium sp.]
MCSSAYAQDSLDSQEPKRVLTDKDIVFDSSDVKQRQFAPDFKQNYKDEAFDYEPKAKELTAWDRFKKWLGDKISRLFEFGGNQTLTVLDWIFKIVLVIVIVVVIFLIAKAILNKEGQWIFGRGTSKRILSAEEIERDIQAADFEKLIAETLSIGDRKLAIRYYYLWLLQKFTRRGIIVWDIEKTNSDYLYEIKSETDRKDFAYLSYLFNYIWYGDFELDDIAFEKAVSAFAKTIKRY